MAGKLHIDIGKGIIDVEGNEELAKEIYADFKDQLLNAAERATSSLDETVSDVDVQKKVTKARKRTKKPDNGERKPKSAEYVPSLMKDLDLSRLPAFYGNFEPKNNPEKILIFLKFLKEEGRASPYTADQVYSCYKIAKERPPKVFLQAFRDASGRNYGYISYAGPESITITQLGETHFDHDLKRKESDA